MSKASVSKQPVTAKTRRAFRRSFSPRVIAVILIILMIFMGWILFWQLYAQRAALLHARQQALANQLELAISLCQALENEVSERHPREAMLESAMDLLGELHYGPQQVGYYYIIGDAGQLLMHPLHPELVGTQLSQLRDTSNRSVISEIVGAAKQNGSGLIEYTWQCPGDMTSTDLRTASFARFEPWGWIIVTDTSSADIDAIVAGELWRQLGTLVVIVVVMSIVLVVTLRRLVLTGVDNLIHVADRLRQGDYSARVEVSPMDEMGYVSRAVNEMATHVEQREERIRLTQRTSVYALAKLTEARDLETGGHLLRVREYSKALAFALRDKPGWDELITGQFIADLYDAVMLHDIGKVGVPDNILLKPDVLDEAERTQMMGHTMIGSQTIRAARREMGVDSSFLEMAEQIARSHHERWDGTGYVEGLAGEAIPAPARIFTVADVYDALTSVRPYKQAYSHEQTVGMMAAERGRHYDPVVLDAFLENSHEFDRIRQEFADGSTKPASWSLHQPGGYLDHWGEKSS